MTTAERVRELIEDIIGLEAGTAADEKRIADDLGADSLDSVTLIIAAEEEFGIEINDDEAEKVRTVADAITLVERLAA